MKYVVRGVEVPTPGRPKLMALRAWISQAAETTLRSLQKVVGENREAANTLRLEAQQIETADEKKEQTEKVKVLRAVALKHDQVVFDKSPLLMKLETARLSAIGDARAVILDPARCRLVGCSRNHRPNTNRGNSRKANRGQQLFCKAHAGVQSHLPKKLLRQMVGNPHLGVYAAEAAGNETIAA